MAKPTGFKASSSEPPKSKKDLRPRFIRPRHVMPAGASHNCTYQFPRRKPPQFAVIAAK